MKCLKKILTRPQTCLGFCALVLSVFLSLGLSSDSHATSGTCTWNFSISNSNSTSSSNISTICPDVSDSYFVLDSYSITFSTLNRQADFRFTTYDLSQPATLAKFTVYPGTYSYSSSDIPIINVYSNIGGSFSLQLRNSWSGFSLTGSAILRYSDSLSELIGIEPCLDCPEPEDPEPCPPIPENPYDDKLDAIKTAIYSCGATVLVVYFFVCIYKIINKDGGSRR